MRASSFTRRAFQFRPSGAIRSVSCSPSKIMRLRMPSTKACRAAVARPCLPAMAASSAAFLLGLEAAVAVADGLFARGLSPAFERADVGGDVLALVHELGVGLDQADELLAAHLLLARRLLREAGDQAHDVVVIDDGGGEEDELEIELVHVRARLVRRSCPAAP